MRKVERLPVAVIGAGPVGATCAFGLWRRGIPVVLLEAEPAPVIDQRAASTQPPTLEILAELGLYEKALARGLVSPTFRFFDRLTGERIAEFDCGLLRDDTPYPFVLQHEQFKLVDTILKTVAGEADFAVRFSAKLAGFSQGADDVALDVEGPDGRESLRASYLIGCDGGRSTVRKLADIAFEGFTYPEKFIKIGTTFDFLSIGRDYCFRNYFSDPDEWCNLFKVKGDGEPGIWRAIFPSRVGETDDEALSDVGMRARLTKFFPGNADWAIAYSAIYAVNQRVAETFRKGRVLLAGDAAHVNNPIGGMGMNGGIHDAANLYERLAPVWRGAADDSELDVYSRQRRKAQLDFVQQQTIRNKKQLEERDPARRREHLDVLKRIGDTPALARDFLRNATLINSVHAAAKVA
jgi:3-(3-hydroxy-phenyl)propionate hydroxylase